MGKAFADWISMGAVLLIGAAALRQPLPPSPVEDDAAAQGPTAVGPCGSEDAAYLRGELYGAIALRVDWRGPDLECAGGRRSSGTGARVLFGGLVPGGERLLFVLGIEAVAGVLAGSERPTNVTVIDETTGRFYSSGGPGRCWADVQLPLAADGRGSAQRIRGVLYCAGALPSLNDRSSLTLGDLAFAGRLDAELP